MTTPFAFVFPGQGSQTVGMLDAWGDHAAVRATLQEASEALGLDMAALIAQGPKEQLDLTTNTQPVMLTAGIACYRAWLAETGIKPVIAAGHSLGEYSALVAAGALSLSQALPLVRLRAQAMQEAVPVGQGGMAAILGLDGEAVLLGCAQARELSGEVVEAVNFNDPKQTVIAGSKAGVEKGMEILKAAGAKRALPLPVSAPFHSSLMKPAAERLKVALEAIDFQPLLFPVINNVDVATPQGADALRDALYRQAYQPVRWVELVQAIAGRGMTQVIECGPGRVLAGMVKRIDANLGSTSVFDPASLAEARSQIGAPCMSNRIALVTGATRGIGAAIATRLVETDHFVVGTATSAEGASKIQVALGERGLGVVLNVTDAAACEALVNQLVTERGGLHVLVNNAGITRDTLALRLKDEDWDAVLDTNLKSVFRLCRLAIKPMMKQRHGRIVSITSVVGASGNAGQANYAAAKAGLAGMSRALAREVGSRGITVNCVAPGFIATDMTAGLPEAQQQALLAQIPLGRLGEAREVAEAVAFLASPNGGYVTGSELHVNGGMYMA